MEITNTDLGTVVGVPVVLLLSCIILAIMFYCRCYIPAQRKKTLERAHVTYIADPTSRPGKINKWRVKFRIIKFKKCSIHADYDRLTYMKSNIQKIRY